MNVKISFIAMIVYAMYTLITKLIIFVKFNWFLYIFTIYGRLAYSLYLVMFLVIHWEFTTHYLQVACLFQASI